MTDANLSGIDLSGINVKKVYFFRTNLSGVNLSGYNLSSEHDLFPVRFDSCNLSNANLSGTSLYGATLENSNLEGANLTGANLERANLEGSNLTSSILINVNLNYANLINVNLHGTDLRGIRRHNDNRNSELRISTIIDLSGSNLSNANLSGLYLEVKLTNANLSETNLSNARLTVGNLSGTNLSGANLSGSSLSGNVYFGNSNIRNVTLSGVNLTGARLRRFNLTSIDLRQVYLNNASINDCLLNNVNLSAVDLSNTNFTNCNLSGANLSNAILNGTIFNSCSLDGTIFTEVSTSPETSFISCSNINPDIFPFVGHIIEEEEEFEEEYEWVDGNDDEPRVNAIQVHQVAAKVNTDELLARIDDLIGKEPEGKYNNFVEYVEITIGNLIRTDPYFESKREQVIQDYNILVGVIRNMIDYGFIAESKKRLYGRCIDFAFSVNPQLYSDIWISENAHAYEASHGNTESCGPGIFERFFLKLADMLAPNEDPRFKSIKDIFNPRTFEQLSGQLKPRWTGLIQNWIAHNDTPEMKAKPVDEIKQIIKTMIITDFRESYLRELPDGAEQSLNEILEGIVDLIEDFKSPSSQGGGGYKKKFLKYSLRNRFYKAS